jgi:carboxyl-terminal processing protease
MTIAQFFRINGGTTQLRGVTPDIKLPTMGDTDTSANRATTTRCRGAIKPAPTSRGD